MAYDDVFNRNTGGGTAPRRVYNAPVSGGGSAASYQNQNTGYTNNPTGGSYNGYGISAGGTQAQSSASDLYNSQRAAAEAAFAERDAARQRAYDALVGGLQSGYNHGAKQANSVAARALQEAYVNRMMSERNMGQQLSSLGRSGGAAETTLLNLQNAYGRERGEHERTRAETLADLRLQLNQGVAQAKADLENARAGDAMAKFQALSTLEAQFAEALASQQQKQAASLARGSSAYSDATGDGAAQMSAQDAYNKIMAEMRNNGVSGNGGPYSRRWLNDYYNSGQISEGEMKKALGMFW